MIDNFELIDPLFYFNEANDMFFFLQIVARAKDHKGKEKKVKEKAIKTYFVTSREHLQSIKDEVVMLCEQYGARAYINVSGKDFYRLQRDMLYKLAEYNATDTIVNPFRMVNRIAGACKSRASRWVIDIDDISLESSILGWLTSYFGDEHYLWATIPTVQGKHLVTRPFNLKQFQEAFPDVDVHKNSMGTLLYFPKSLGDSEPRTLDYSFNAFDSELMHYEWTIPEGYSAEIKDGKILINSISKQKNNETN